MLRSIGRTAICTMYGGGGMLPADTSRFDLKMPKETAQECSTCGLLKPAASQANIAHRCQYHSRPYRYTQYLELAISIVIDLRLDRKPETRPWKRRLDVQVEVADQKETLDLDERRAVVGCYYLSCSIAKMMQKHCSFPWTPHIAQCCQTLSQRQHASTDKYIQPMIELQHIIEQSDVRVSLTKASTLEPIDSGLDESQAADLAKLTQLRSDVAALKSNLSYSILECHSLKMLLHTAELYLCLIGISTEPGLNSLPEGEKWPAWRLDLLSAGIVAAKSLLDFDCAQVLGSEKNYNNTEWIQISFALMLATRLAVVCNQPSVQGQTAHLRSFLDMAGVLTDFINRVKGMVTEQTDDLGDRDVFYRIVRRFQRLEAWFQAQTSQAQLAALRDATAQAGDRSGTTETGHIDQVFEASLRADQGPVAPGMSMHNLQPDPVADGWFDPPLLDLMDFSELGNPLFDAAFDWTGVNCGY